MHATGAVSTSDGGDHEGIHDQDCGFRRAGRDSLGCGDSSAPETEPAFGGVHPDGCIEGGKGLQHVTCDDLQLDLHVSAECLERACGLIVDVHGSTMNGDQQEAHTSLGALAQGRGYLVLQPWAPGTPPSWESEAALDARVLALVERVIDVFSVDRRRIHFTGFSQGGFMTWRMLCDRPDLFASFAPLAGTASDILYKPDKRCAEATGGLLAARPVFYGHGMADAVVDFGGATMTLEALRTAWSLSEQETLDAGVHYQIVRYSGDGPGLVELMQHDLRTEYTEAIFGAWEGHCYPGSDAPIGCGAGPAWGEAVLRFFEAHPKR